jgi:predicted amidophosphoribosyltransferase
MTCYDSATCIVGMPPSMPHKLFDLPAYLALNIAKGLNKPDLTSLVKTIKERPQLKDEPIEKKLESIEGTVSISPRTLENQVVLLVDDLYQSGVSTNYVAMLMLEAGAKEVFGLACEKTCRNNDNVSRSSIK